MKRVFSLAASLAIVACAPAQGAGPVAADVLRVEKELAAEIRNLKKIGYPEFEKTDTGEQPVEIANLRCDAGSCTYDVVVQSKIGRRSVHRPGVTLCQNPDDVWVGCVS